MDCSFFFWEEMSNRHSSQKSKEERKQSCLPICYDKEVSYAGGVGKLASRLCEALGKLGVFFPPKILSGSS